MSVRVVQVDESQKDEPGVQKAVTTIGDQTIETYARLERVDDLDGKTTEDVVEIEMLIPVEDEDGEEGDYIFNRAVIDLGAASLKKYLKAIEPFADKARLAPAQPAKAAPAASSGGRVRNPEITAWNHRAKEWLRKTGLGDEVKDRGRLPAKLESIYVKANPDDPKPE